MTKQQGEILRLLRVAREVIKRADPCEAGLVKSLYDLQLRVFAQMNTHKWSDEEYAIQWDRRRDLFCDLFDREGYVLREDFNSLWNAYDILATEVAMSYA